MPRNLSLFSLFKCDTILGGPPGSQLYKCYMCSKSIIYTFMVSPEIYSCFEFMLVHDSHKDPLLTKARYINLDILVNLIKYYSFSNVDIEFVT